LASALQRLLRSSTLSGLYGAAASTISIACMARQIGSSRSNAACFFTCFFLGLCRLFLLCGLRCCHTYGFDASSKRLDLSE
jgi:hypothetical protein